MSWITRAGIEEPRNQSLPTEYIISHAYEMCPACKGSGDQVGIYYVQDCDTCYGRGEVRIRDAKGRFTTIDEVIKS